jgi:glycosyltransferase involved in cell wall biosynthesis
MNRDISIVYLWSEFTGYAHGVARILAERVRSVDVVHWDKKQINSSHYDGFADSCVGFHGRTAMTELDIYNLLIDKDPSIVVVSGWMDKAYISACKQFKKRNPNVKIVAGIDLQWTGSLRQKFGSFYYGINYRHLFDYIWVSGSLQFAYAINLGYHPTEIISNLYSGSLVSNSYRINPANKLIYVGRLMRSKGIDLLIEAHKSLQRQCRERFPLHVFGDGELREFVKEATDAFIIYHGWAKIDTVTEFLTSGAVGVMPSRKENWGVAIHEYTQLGLPLLLSDSCGAANELLISGYNGYKFRCGSSKDLASKICIFADTNEAELIRLGECSVELSARITPSKSAASLLSVI